MDNWAAMMGSSCKGRQGGGVSGGRSVEVLWEVPWLVVSDKSFWRALVFVSPAQVTSYIRACTENMGDSLSLFPKDILHLS
jgi:hypothetical protein